MRNKLFICLILTLGAAVVTGCKSSTPSPHDKTGDDARPGKDELRILHWNIESGGNQPTVIADQLQEFAIEGGYQIFALSEVDAPEVYRDRFQTLDESGNWKVVLGISGSHAQRQDDRLMVLYDSSRLKLISSTEMKQYEDHQLNTGRHRTPMVVHFEDIAHGQSFLLLHNHLARGDADFRRAQAIGLREFARNDSRPMIAVGDYNFDFVFKTRQGNDGFVEFVRDGIWKWIEPAELIDSNWFDPEGDGIDNYPGSILDFTFVSGPAKEWDVSSRVIVRDGDFPDDESTSDHRPLEVIVRF